MHRLLLQVAGQRILGFLSAFLYHLSFFSLFVRIGGHLVLCLLATLPVSSWFFLMQDTELNDICNSLAIV